MVDGAVTTDSMLSLRGLTRPGPQRRRHTLRRPPCPFQGGGMRPAFLVEDCHSLFVTGEGAAMTCRTRLQYGAKQPSCHKGLLVRRTT